MTDKQSSSLSSLFKSGMDRLDKLGIPAVTQLQSTIRQQVAIHNPNQPQETLKLQLALVASKGVVLDEQSLAREQKLYSKQFFLYGKDEKGADLVDISDRIAFLIFKTAELEEAHALRLTHSRQALKDIRNFENELVPKRTKRAVLANKLAGYKQSHPRSDKNTTGQIAQLQSELEKLEREDATFEQSLEALKRAKIHEAFSVHFAAQRELGEKLALVGGYGERLLQAMEIQGVADDYSGHEHSAAVRAEVVSALEAWSPATPLIPTPELHVGGGSSFLGRSDTQSFGRTHASELSQLDNPGQVVPGQIPSSPSPPPLPLSPRPIPTTSPSPHQSLPGTFSPPNPLPINLAPTSPPLVPNSPPLPTATISGIPTGPTVAETGPPKVGTNGPSSGQLPISPTSSSAPGHPIISLASIGSPDPATAQANEAFANQSRADASRSDSLSSTSATIGGTAPSPLVLPGAESESSREQATRWKEAEAASERAQAGGLAASGSSSSGSLGRMATTSRRRLEANEVEFGAAGGEELPAYVGVAGEESEDERARRELEEIRAAERERKTAPPGAFQ